MKKISIITLILFCIILFSIILKFDSRVVVYIYDYEIFTNFRFILLILLILCLLISFTNFLYYTIFSINKSKVKKLINKEKKKNSMYLDNIYNAMTNAILDDKQKSIKYLIRADKILKNDKMTDLIKKHFYDGFNEINETLIDYNISLTKALNENNLDIAEQQANNILKIRKNDKKSLVTLYKINKTKENWQQCSFLIDKIEKYILKEDFINEKIFIYKKLAIFYFNQNDFKQSFKFSTHVFKFEKFDKTNNYILIKSVANLSSNRILIKYIEKIWKYTPNIDIGNVYISLSNNNVKSARKLYKINKMNIVSIVLYCNILIKNNNIDLISSDIINELNKYNYKEVFEILINIEKQERANSLLINSLKEKAINAKSIKESLF